MDTHGYVEFYNNLLVRPSDFYQQFEPGFYYFSLATTVFDSYEAYIFLITAFQLVLMYVSIKLLNCRNAILPLAMYVSFVPGLDMLTNGIRGGLALSIACFCITFSLRFNILNRISVIIASSVHYSILIVLFVQFISSFKLKYKLLVRLNVLVFFIFLFWRVMDVSQLLAILDSYTKGYSVFSKFVRYLVIEKQLMDENVKLYFMVVSLLLSVTILYLSKMVQHIEEDNIFIRLFYISTLLLLLYAAVSFSEYAYRFMFLAYPFQILLIAYLSERTKCPVKTQCLLYAMALAMAMVTYTTKTYSSFEFFQIF
ncbi:hypothetical protein GCM10007169_16730 [Shewanella fodinae]|nr:hypothetical protein GCM10007169_16730 [Shewanella fodinae]